MRPEAVGALQCPFCLTPVEVVSILDERSHDIESGVLACSGCRFEFPVIGGIAILMGPDERIDIKSEVSASTLLGGPRTGQLVRLIRSGRHLEALSRLLGPAHDEGALFPGLERSAWEQARRAGTGVPRPLVDTTGARDATRDDRSRSRARGPGGSARRWARRFRSGARLLLLPRARLRLATFLEEHADEITALDAITIYYGRYSGSGMRDYFALRFGQPRHLATLALAGHLARTDGPILDLACGAGHLTHFLTRSFPNRQVFGLDRAFFRLLLARRYVAPNAGFICADADRALPFPPQSLGGVFCSDAFHYFVDRAATIRESQRTLREGGLIVFTRFGNADVDPREGYELSLDGYRGLLGGWPHVFFGEDELLDRYLEGWSPSLREESPSTALRRQKWLSVVCAGRPDDLGAGMRFAEWPHSLGKLRVNPIYSARPLPDGDVELELRFPSEWYAFENGRYLDYAPERCRVSKADLDLMERGERSGSMEKLIAQCVVIGLPDRYM